MKITLKLFFTLFAVTTCIILANFILARWSFHQGFLEFIGGMEEQRLSDGARDLTMRYEQEGNWDWLKTQGIEDFFAQQISNFPQGRPRRGRPPMHGQPAGRGPGSMPPKRGRDRPNGPRGVPLGPPTALFDNKGNFVSGRDLTSTTSHGVRVPLILNNERIGELMSWPTVDSSSLLASQFSRQQLWTSALIAILCLAVAGLISWLSAKRLLRPVKGILGGVSELTKGNFKVSFTENRRDELGQLMNDVELLSQTLEKNRTAKNRWFADISHELRTPLTVLTGEIDVLKAGIRSFDHDQLVSFEQEIRRLNHLVDDLYQLSLSDVGGLRYSFSEHNLRTCIGDVVEQMQIQAEDKNLELSFIGKQDVWANIDKQRLDQLLLNLCNNSLAYTDAPGSIIFDLEQNDGTIKLTVDDTYPSVDEAECAHLFDPLYRQDLSRTRRESGAGLGLTICKNIVEAHGGNISASPSKLGGVQVSIELKAIRGVSN